jgi:hypothetical protein
VAYFNVLFQNFLVETEEKLEPAGTNVEFRTEYKCRAYRYANLLSDLTTMKHLITLIDRQLGYVGM